MIPWSTVSVCLCVCHAAEWCKNWLNGWRSYLGVKTLWEWVAKTHFIRGPNPAMAWGDFPIVKYRNIVRIQGGLRQITLLILLLAIINPPVWQGVSWTREGVTTAGRWRVSGWRICNRWSRRSTTRTTSVCAAAESCSSVDWTHRPSKQANTKQVGKIR